MGQQILISLGREFGSGGHQIAQGIAEALGIEYYDKNILEKIFADDPEAAKEMEDYDEKAASSFLTRRVVGLTNSMENILADKEFEFVSEKAKSGESFVIVGRCGEVVLKDYKNHISIFIHGDMDDKVKRVMERMNLDADDAIEKIEQMDRSRRKYHDSHSETGWGESRSYDISVNVSKLGIDRSLKMLVEYIKNRLEED